MAKPPIHTSLLDGVTTTDASGAITTVTALETGLVHPDAVSVMTTLYVVVPADKVGAEYVVPFAPGILDQDPLLACHWIVKEFEPPVTVAVRITVPPTHASLNIGSTETVAVGSISTETTLLTACPHPLFV